MGSERGYGKRVLPGKYARGGGEEMSKQEEVGGRRREYFVMNGEVGR